MAGTYTTIYWLLDARTAPPTPFYCGRSNVLTTAEAIRLHWQRRPAPSERRLPVVRKVKECGRNIDVLIVERVPAHAADYPRWYRWMDVLRTHFPGSCINGSVGRPIKPRRALQRDPSFADMRRKLRDKRDQNVRERAKARQTRMERRRSLGI